MPRRALVLLLASLEAAILLTGCRAVVSSPQRPIAAPERVAAVVAVAPAPISVVTKPAPVRKPVQRVKPAVRKQAAAPARKPAVRRTAVRRTQRTAPQLTGRLLMLAAVARIPGYQPGTVSWVMTTRYDSWGTADWYRGVVYISPRVPANRMYDVVAHEWSHLVSVRPYPSVKEATAAMNREFGGSGLTGAERAADCMARRLGAGWTHYTSCSRDSWQTAAARLLAGHAV